MRLWIDAFPLPAETFVYFRQKPADGTLDLLAPAFLGLWTGQRITVGFQSKDDLSRSHYRARILFAEERSSPYGGFTELVIQPLGSNPFFRPASDWRQVGF